MIFFSLLQFLKNYFTRNLCVLLFQNCCSHWLSVSSVGVALHLQITSQRLGAVAASPTFIRDIHFQSYTYLSASCVPLLCQTASCALGILTFVLRTNHTVFYLSGDSHSGTRFPGLNRHCYSIRQYQQKHAQY